MDDQLGPDVRLALSAIAAELGVDPDQLPMGVVGILHAFGAARYGEGARDWLLIHVRKKTSRGFPAFAYPQISTEDVTPVITKHGRRKRDEGGSDGNGE